MPTVRTGEFSMDMHQCRECGKPLRKVAVFCRRCNLAFCSVECLNTHRAKDPERHDGPDEEPEPPAPQPPS
jgi:hypothetical protein